jgi:DNA-binding transcriptional ArsR family regulator
MTVDEMELVFKALAAETRRRLLDRLFQRDGQSLNELVVDLDMSRFGVMKHLTVLEDAGLITTRKAGREKLHYLNPVPIAQTYERWVAKYAAPYVHTMTALKTEPETKTVSESVHVYEIIIRTSPDALLCALIEPELVGRYFFGMVPETTWEPGSPYVYRGADGSEALRGDIIEFDPPKGLVTRGVNLYSAETAAEPPGTVPWAIEPQGENCKLTVTHELPGTPLTAELVSGGWVAILSGLKTLLETGEPLTFS